MQNCLQLFQNNLLLRIKIINGGCIINTRKVFIWVLIVPKGHFYYFKPYKICQYFQTTHSAFHPIWILNWLQESSKLHFKCSTQPNLQFPMNDFDKSWLNGLLYTFLNSGFLLHQFVMSQKFWPKCPKCSDCLTSHPWPLLPCLFLFLTHVTNFVDQSTD